MRVFPTFPDLAFVSRSCKEIGRVEGVRPTDPVRCSMPWTPRPYRYSSATSTWGKTTLPQTVQPSLYEGRGMVWDWRGLRTTTADTATSGMCRPTQKIPKALPPPAGFLSERTECSRPGIVRHHPPRTELVSRSLQDFFYDASCIQLDAVQGSYSPVFRGGSGVRFWVGAFIGIKYVEGFDLPSGYHTPGIFLLTFCGCKVSGPIDDPLSLGSRADILPKGGRADPPPPIPDSSTARSEIPADAG